MKHSQQKSIFVQGSEGAAHNRRMLEGLSSFCHNQNPPWRLRWGPTLPFGDLLGKKYDGVVFFHQPPEALALLRSCGVPVVQVGTPEAPGEFPAVLPNHQAVAELGLEHFRERLFRNFAFVGESTQAFSHLRLQTIRESLAPSERLHVFEFASSEASAYPRLRDWLKSLPKHTGILAASDYLALPVCNFCEELGRKIPEDLAVLGVDNDELAVHTALVPFSSIDVASNEIGRRAGEMLQQLMDGMPLRRRVLLIPPVGVVLRASTDHLATEDEKVAAAARFMRQEACTGLKVDEICRRLGLSRRMFELRFHRELGRSPEAEMRRIRMDRARYLLQTTNQSIQEVAEASGFQDHYYFSSAFKREHGLSPRAWRKAQT